MEAVNITTVAQKIVPNGNHAFIHLFNNSDENIYIAYDGATATVAAGVIIYPGQSYALNNDGAKPIFTRGVSALHGGTGNKELRIQLG